MGFSNATDICNSALQSVGARRIAAGALATETSKEASECNAVYDKMRRAELRRNVWAFAIKTAVIRAFDDGSSTGTPTLKLVPAAWSSTKTYVTGSVITYSGATYILTGVQSSLNEQPDITPASWSQYFGPRFASAWDSTVSYYAGELVYTPTTDAYKVYLSLKSENSDTPGTSPAYAATTVYNKGDTVTYLSVVYQSTEDLNVGNTPTGAGKWVAVPGTQPDYRTGGWLLLDATLQSFQPVYPIGSGPLSQTSSRNVFFLPSNFLRRAPDDPKAGSTSWLGGPSGLYYDDWNVEGEVITSTDTGPIILRFVADVSDVTKMDDMFCEGLACRIALKLCETFTQSSAKKQELALEYKNFMSEARIVNGIETGATEPPEDDYVACRI